MCASQSSDIRWYFQPLRIPPQSEQAETIAQQSTPPCLLCMCPIANCHVALYGGIESNYFEIVIADDMLERYLNQT